MTPFGVMLCGQSMCPRTAAPGSGCAGVREQMLLEEPLIGHDVVADEQHDLARGALDSQVARLPGTCILLTVVPQCEGKASDPAAPPVSRPLSHRRSTTTSNSCGRIDWRARASRQDNNLSFLLKVGTTTVTRRPSQYGERSALGTAASAPGDTRLSPRPPEAPS